MEKTANERLWQLRVMFYPGCGSSSVGFWVAWVLGCVVSVCSVALSGSDAKVHAEGENARGCISLAEEIC